MLLLMVKFHSYCGWVIFHFIYMHHIFIQSSFHGCLGCFHMLANNAALNTEAHVSFRARVFAFSDIYVAVELLGHMVVFLFFVLFFCFFEKPPYYFPWWLHQFTFFFFFSYNQNGFTFWNWDPCPSQVKREVPCWCTGSNLSPVERRDSPGNWQLSNRRGAGSFQATSLAVKKQNQAALGNGGTEVGAGQAAVDCTLTT